MRLRMLCTATGAGKYHRFDQLIRHLPIEGTDSDAPMYIFGSWGLAQFKVPGPYFVDLDDNYFDDWHRVIDPELFLEVLFAAKVVTVASEALRTRLAEEGIEAVYCPTGLEPFPLAPTPPTFTVAWRGARANATIEAIRKYIDIAWGKGEFVPWVEFPVYWNRLKDFPRSCEILPATDSPVGRCKSPLKMYEAMAAGVPCIVSALPPYGPEVAQGAPALVYESIEEIPALLERLRDPVERERLGRAGREWVRRERDVTKTVWTFHEAWRKA